MGFTKQTSRLANARRKKRFPKECRKREEVVYKERVHRHIQVQQRRGVIRQRINGLLRDWLQDLASGGSNNAISCAGIEVVVQRLNKLRGFTASSVFVDLGCSIGIPSIYVAMLTGARTIGIEKDAVLVAKARRNAERCGVGGLCTFVCMDLNDLKPSWFVKHGVTHVMAFDAVFGAETLAKMYRCLASVRMGLVGAGTSENAKFWVPTALLQVGHSSSGIKLAGRGASTFRFRFWRHGG